MDEHCAYNDHCRYAQEGGYVSSQDAHSSVDLCLVIRVYRGGDEDWRHIGKSDKSGWMVLLHS
jgi:hypothetical protein